MLDIKNKDFFRDLLEGQYLAKFTKSARINIPLPPLPLPDPGPLGPRPPRGISIDPRDELLGDLLIRSLADPTPQPNKLLLVNQIRNSGLHLEVIKDLASQFEDGARALRAEQKVFEDMNRC